MLALAATLVFRGWLSAVAPVTADEAYFVLWGRSPAIGYYDHPPMVGWMLAPLVALADAGWVARLPAVLVPALAALGVRAALLRWFGRDEDTASLAALAVLLLPMNVWNVLVTTDTPLLLFSVASMLAFARAVQQGSQRWFFASGVLLGLAFLSKYFAVLLGLAFLVHSISTKNFKAFLLVFLGALPFGLQNLYWNYEACWCNVMFNAINRHDEAGLSWTTPLLLAGSIAYLAAPLIWYAWRERARLGWQDPMKRALILAWLVPLAVFAALSPVKRIGLHWLLPFMPALVLTLALALERRHLVVSARWFAAFAALHMAAIGAVAALPSETWSSTRFHSRLVFLLRTPEILSVVAPELERYRLAADSYSGAALLAFHARRAVPVFGPGSSHARHDDILTDWRGYAGKNLLILRRETPLMADYSPYFGKVGVQRIRLRGAEFHAVLGSGFDYAAYRDSVLRTVRERYYRIPPWLPDGRCYFFERYFTG